MYIKDSIRVIYLLLTFNLVKSSAYNVLSTVNINSRIHGGEEKVLTGKVTLNSSDYELMHEAGNEQIVAVVFPSVDIHPNNLSQVQSINVLFDINKVRDASKDPVFISIHGELNHYPANPTSNDFDISKRILTQTTVIWEPQSSIHVHDPLLTPDISIIIKEIVSLPNWIKGNPLCLIFKYINGDGTRWVESSKLHNDIQTPALIWNITPQILTSTHTHNNHTNNYTNNHTANYTTTSHYTETSFILLLEQVAKENLAAAGAVGTALGSVMIGGVLYQVYKTKQHNDSDNDDQKENTSTAEPPQELVVIKPDIQAKTTQYVVVSNKNKNYTVFTKKINDDTEPSNVNTSV